MDTRGSRRAKRWTYTHKKVGVKVLEIQIVGDLAVEVGTLQVPLYEGEVVARH